MPSYLGEKYRLGAFHLRILVRDIQHRKLFYVLTDNQMNSEEYQPSESL